jgi:6-pyruvoyltetrahydropterin/6-carboxytetrahydropterin synthase
MSFQIILEKGTLRFAAAHFTTFAGECEPLHGHNYALTAEITGGLTEDSWVLDFTEAKALLRAICGELDHKFILPLANPALTIRESAAEYEISFGERRYVIPGSDVAALDLANSTAELLAEWAARRLAAVLREKGVGNVMSIRIGVEEAPGQSGWFTMSLAGPSS